MEIIRAQTFHSQTTTSPTFSIITTTDFHHSIMGGRQSSLEAYHNQEAKDIQNAQNIQQGGFRFADIHIGNNGGGHTAGLVVVALICFGMLLTVFIYKCCYLRCRKALTSHIEGISNIRQLEARLEEANEKTKTPQTSVYMPPRRGFPMPMLEYQPE